MRCISGLVIYRQYINNCSSQVDPHLAHGGESSVRSSAPLAWLPPPGWPPLQLSAAAPGLRSAIGSLAASEFSSPPL